jgi:RNA polymerase sigma-70 factor (ECF subfamily)
MTVSEYNSAVDEFSDGLFRFALKNTNNYEGSKDIVQEAFTKLWEKRENVNSEKVKSYLFTTVYHMIIDFTNKAKRKVELKEVKFQSSSNDSAYKGLSRILDEALSKLPEIQKSVILLRDYEGYSYEQIGEITGLSESQVKVYIYRARVTLKEFIVTLENVL